ncbi:hypothetical protein AAMO2058_000396200 [Amorphochlora amoebiformis]
MTALPAEVSPEQIPEAFYDDVENLLDYVSSMSSKKSKKMEKFIDKHTLDRISKVLEGRRKRKRVDKKQIQKSIFPSRKMVRRAGGSAEGGVGTVGLEDVLGVDFSTLGGIKDVVEKLNEIGQILLKRYHMVISGKRYWVVEVEAYLYSQNHQDLCSYYTYFRFTHQDDLQRETSGNWYFHRQGKTKKTFKGGSFMGLDITMGKAGLNTGGLLIRSIADVRSGEVIEGPCNVVKKVLELTKQKSLQALHDWERFHLNAFQQGNSVSLKASSNQRQCTVIGSPRYGLSLKGDGKAKEKWIMAPYRFISEPRDVKRQRSLTALSLWLTEKDLTDSKIKDITGIALKMLDGHRQEFLSGIEEDMSEYHGRGLKAKDLVRMYGAWTKEYGSLFGLEWDPRTSDKLVLDQPANDYELQSFCYKK